MDTPPARPADSADETLARRLDFNTPLGAGVTLPAAVASSLGLVGFSLLNLLRRASRQTGR